MPAAIWGYGFRPFFLAAGLAAVVLVPWWIAAYAYGAPVPAAWPPSLWHGHEMVYGFIAAAVTGFLLTAVPSWTGQRGFGGRPLALLAALWLLGRIAVAGAARVPAFAVAVADVAFLPAVALALAPGLLRTRNRNMPMLLFLFALAACNAVFHHSVASGMAGSARAALLAAVNLMMLLVTLIGGRIVPAFTQSGLRVPSPVAFPRARAALGTASIGMMAAVVLIDIVQPGGRLAGACAALACLVQALRLLAWRGWRGARLPIVWILHVAYAWLPVGLGLKALALLAGAPFAASWMHALTAGAAATMILAVMTRAALGHTGRPLVASRPTVWAYALLTAAAAVRALGPALPLGYAAAIVLAAIFWTGAFALFLAVYAPILTAPRADGRPG